MNNIRKSSHLETQSRNQTNQTIADKDREIQLLHEKLSKYEADAPSKNDDPQGTGDPPIAKKSTPNNA